jgi:hypothetical protein
MVRNRFYELVELQIPGVAGGNTGTTFNFPDEPQLRNVPLFSIVVYDSTSVPLSGFTSTAVATIAQLQKCFLTLYTTDPKTGEQKNGIDRIPLLELNYLMTSTVGEPHVWQMPEFVGQEVTWPKSFITVTSGGIGNATNICILLGVRYGWSNAVQQ